MYTLQVPMAGSLVLVFVAPLGKPWPLLPKLRRKLNVWASWPLIWYALPVLLRANRFVPVTERCPSPASPFDDSP